MNDVFVTPSLCLQQYPKGGDFEGLVGQSEDGCPFRVHREEVSGKLCGEVVEFGNADRRGGEPLEGRETGLHGGMVRQGHGRTGGEVCISKVGKSEDIRLLDAYFFEECLARSHL